MRRTEEITAINSGSTPITLRGLRGQQQSTLSATLQGFAGSSFVRKFHNSLPGGTTLIIRHHNSSFNWSKLGEGLMKEDTRASMTWNKMQVSNNVTGSRWSGSPVPAAHWLLQVTSCALWGRRREQESGFWLVGCWSPSRPAQLWQFPQASEFPARN